MSRERVEQHRILWLSTLHHRDGRPHLTPIWYCWVDDRFWICTNSNAVKTRNVLADARVSVSLESGSAPVVAEASAAVHYRPYPEPVRQAFIATFEWDIGAPDDDGPYDALIELTPTRWLMGAPD